MEKLKLFLRYMHTSLTDQLYYNINLVNSGSNGAIVLGTQRAPIMAGAIEQQSFFAMPDNIIRRRNPDGNELLNLINLANKMKNQIRIAWTTECLNLSRNTWDWLGRDYAQAGVQFGRAMSRQLVQEYLLRCFSILRATVGANPNTVLDVSEQSSDVSGISYENLVYTADRFGDASGEIRAWIMSTVLKTDLLINNIKNETKLFTIGNVTFTTDVEGRSIITSDDPNLRTYAKDGTVKYSVFGLTAGAVGIYDLDDWDELYSEKGGLENILRTYQANWSSKIGIKGYKYDESQLTDSDDDRGKFASASDAALDAPENWEQYTSSHKATAGVMLVCRSSRPSWATPTMYNHN